MSSDSNQEFIEKFEKIEKEYLKNPDLEEIASEYLKMLCDLALQQDDEQSLQEIVIRASGVYDTHSDSEEIANRYLWILCFLAFQQDDEQSLQETVIRASSVYDNHSDSEENANNYLWILRFLVSQQEDEKKLQETVNKASSVYDTHSGSEEIANNYLWILCSLASQQDDEQSLQETAIRASSVYNNHSGSEENAINYLWILRFLAFQQDDEQSLQETVIRASSVYDHHSGSEEIANNYSVILYYLASQQDDEQSLKETAIRASSVYDHHLGSEEIANNYLWILRFLASQQDDEQSLKETAIRASSVYDNHLGSEENANNYLWILCFLVSKQDDEKSLNDMVVKATSVYNKYSDSGKKISAYLWILYYIASKQDDEKSLNDTVIKATYAYKKDWEESWELDPVYISILECLASKQKKVEDLNHTADIAKTIYEKSNCNKIDVKKIFDEIMGVNYLSILCYQASKQEDEEKLKDIKSIANDIYNKYSDFVEVIKLFSKILVSMIRIENNIETLNEHLKELEKLLESPLNEKFDLVVGIISDILSNINKKINHGEVIEQEQLKCWLNNLINKLINIESVQKTNNGMLVHLLERYEHDSIGIEHILNIYNLVLQIKYELAVKEFPRKGFGHYTSARTLQIHLNQEKNISKQRGYKVTSKSRLYNVDYMNDPEEGKILDRYLSQQKENKIYDSLEPSPWFLMCLTTAIDDLAMWSQYGANAEGVFLELKSDNFQLVSTPKDIDWLSGQSNFGETNSNQDKEHSLLEQESKQESKQESEKEKLFRICYLDEHELKRGKLLVSSEDVLLKKKEREKVTSLLSKLKEKIDNVYELESPELLSDVNKLLEEIRYLFKASGYKYEKELRVLRYATIESAATELTKELTTSESTSTEPMYSELIGIQYDSDTLAKPYLEREDPIQIKRVIFGPKFSRPEYVTPLIRLVDKDIEFTISERKFK